uniref:CSON000276 protein n=1 Tax=Culicoides sonorensis TaxID=179676 RepID=A0A336MDX5_CULSO
MPNGDVKKTGLDKTMKTFGSRIRTRFGTWNVRTLFQLGKLRQLAAEAVRLRIDVLGVSETRWTSYGDKKLSSGQYFVYSGHTMVNAPHEYGVGFLLSPLAHRALMEWKPISERIIVARFKGRYRNITAVQCYAPTNQADLSLKEGFYEQLTSVFENVHKKDILLLLGDFNAQIGTDNANLECVMGKHALGEMTENGELFTEFCGVNEMVIGGSLFPHKRNHKVSWSEQDNNLSKDVSLVLYQIILFA